MESLSLKRGLKFAAVLGNVSKMTFHETTWVTAPEKTKKTSKQL